MFSGSWRWEEEKQQIAKMSLFVVETVHCIQLESTCKNLKIHLEYFKTCCLPELCWECDEMAE